MTNVTNTTDMNANANVVAAVSDSAPGVAIIGFGTAGMNALIGLRTAGYEGPVRIFSNAGELPYSPILTSYYAAGFKQRKECFPWSAEEVADLKAEVLAACPVESLDIDAHLVRTPQGDFPYAKCIIASGSRPMAYGFPPVQGGEYQPLMLRTMENADRLKDALEAPRCKHILVSGASMVALKVLEAALARDVKVTLVGMNPHILDFNALPETAERIEGHLRDCGVELRLGMVVKAVEYIPAGSDANDADTWQLKVTFSNGDIDVFDEISVSHGMRSNLEFLPEGALEMDRALLVDEFMRTSNPDVYAAGDVVQALELISGERRIVGIWKTAARQGFVAGKAIAAELAGQEPAATDAYEGAFATNTIVINDCLFISAGTMEITDNRRIEITEDDSMTIARIWEKTPDGRERLVGFSLASDDATEGNRAYDTGAMLTKLIGK